MRVFFACAILVACTGSASPRNVALPEQSPSPVEPARGSLTRGRERVELAHGVLVDIVSRQVVRDFVSDLDYVQNEAFDGEIAYEHVHRYDASDDEIRAYRASTGRLLWTRVKTCWAMVATQAGLFCAGSGGDIVLFMRATGRERVTAWLGWRVSTLVRAGRHVVAVGGDIAHAAMFDASSGARVADLDLPGRMRVAIADAGRVCGLADATALCFDASPQVLWSKTLASPVVLRTSDGHDMLVNAGVESIALSLVDGREDASVLGAMASLVRAESGRLAGFVRTPPNVAFVDVDGRERWTTDAFPYANAATAVIAGDLVVIAAYATSTAGASLEA